MQKFSSSYSQNVDSINRALRVQESFDVLCKTLKIGDGELTMFFIDGFTKDTAMQQLMMHFISVGEVSERIYAAQRAVYRGRSHG